MPDFYLLCTLTGAQVELDQSAAQRIKKESPAPSAFSPESYLSDQPSSSTRAGNLHYEHSRAAIFAILLAVVNGKSRVRLQVSHHLTQP